MFVDVDVASRRDAYLGQALSSSSGAVQPQTTGGRVSPQSVAHGGAVVETSAPAARSFVSSGPHGELCYEPLTWQVGFEDGPQPIGSVLARKQPTGQPCQCVRCVARRKQPKTCQCRHCGSTWTIDSMYRDWHTTSMWCGVCDIELEEHSDTESDHLRQEAEGCSLSNAAGSADDSDEDHVTPASPAIHCCGLAQSVCLGGLESPGPLGARAEAASYLEFLFERPHAKAWGLKLFCPEGPEPAKPTASGLLAHK